jgi:hypothetical protein
MSTSKGITYSVQANIQPIDPNTGLFTPVWYLYLISLQTQIGTVIQGNDALYASMPDASDALLNLQSAINSVLSKVELLPDLLPEISNIKLLVSSLNSELHSSVNPEDGDFALKNLINTQASFIAHILGVVDTQQAQIDSLVNQVNSLQSYVNQIEV